MKLLVIASILAVTSCSHLNQYQYQPPQVRALLPVPRHSAETLAFDHVHPGDGSYRFSYQSGESSVQESGSPRAAGPEGAAVTAEGGFSYTAPDGQLVSLTYTADERGFHPVGSHVPTPPPIPEAILRSLQSLGHHSGYYPSNQGAYHQNSDSLIVDA